MKTETFSPVTTKMQFIKEWTPEQFTKMQRAIRTHFSGKKIRTRHGDHAIRNYTDADNIFGLAYTSTGIWACYGVCNTEVYFDCDNIYKYSYFTIGENGIYYAVLQDNEENELVIEL